MREPEPIQPGKCAPVYPLTLELAPYRHESEPGYPGEPFTYNDLAAEIGDRICLARVTLDDSNGSRASVFISVVLTRGGLMIEMNQDQTAYGGTMDVPIKTARREFKLRFFPRA